MTSHTPHNEEKADWEKERVCLTCERETEDTPCPFCKGTVFRTYTSMGDKIAHEIDLLIKGADRVGVRKRLQELFEHAQRQERQRLLDEVLETVGEDVDFNEYERSRGRYKYNKHLEQRVKEYYDGQNIVRAQLREKLQALR